MAPGRRGTGSWTGRCQAPAPSGSRSPAARVPGESGWEAESRGCSGLQVRHQIRRDPAVEALDDRRLGDDVRESRQRQELERLAGSEEGVRQLEAVEEV